MSNRSNTFQNEKCITQLHTKLVAQKFSIKKKTTEQLNMSASSDDKISRLNSKSDEGFDNIGKKH